MSSPVDNALEMKKKRQHLHQQAAKQQQQRVVAAPEQLQPLAQPVLPQAAPTSMVFGISDCDLGASPQMNKGSLITKMAQHQMAIGKMSPLGVQARYFSLSKNNSGAQ
jgi:hypothetical protein